MLLLVTQAMPQMRQYADAHLGRLLTPRHDCSAHEHDGLSWAADNDCFGRLDPLAYTAMLDRIAGSPGRCLFVAVPDVVADARSTAHLFELWWRAPARRGLPLALVAQDGLEHLGRWLALVWPRIDALFLGGSTAWKLGACAEALAREAKARGKWVHMGRVNSARRIAYAASIGCDSVDGTKWVRWRETYLRGGIEQVARPVQLRLAPAEQSHSRSEIHDTKGEGQ